MIATCFLHLSFCWSGEGMGGLMRRRLSRNLQSGVVLGVWGPSSLPSQVNWPRQTDREQTDCEETISLQWFHHWFRRSDFVTRRGFGPEGSGDIRNQFRFALFSQSALSAVSLLAVSWFAVSLSRPVVVDPSLLSVRQSRRKTHLYIYCEKINFRKAGLHWFNSS